MICSSCLYFAENFVFDKYTGDQICIESANKLKTVGEIRPKSKYNGKRNGHLQTT